VNSYFSSGNKSLSPREYIRQKQMERASSSATPSSLSTADANNTPSQKATWFFDFNNGEKADEEELKVQHAEDSDEKDKELVVPDQTPVIESPASLESRTTAVYSSSPTVQRTSSRDVEYEHAPQPPQHETPATVVVDDFMKTSVTANHATERSSPDENAYLQEEKVRVPISLTCRDHYGF